MIVIFASVDSILAWSIIFGFFVMVAFEIIRSRNEK